MVDRFVLLLSCSSSVLLFGLLCFWSCFAGRCCGCCSCFGKVSSAESGLSRRHRTGACGLGFVCWGSCCSTSSHLCFLLLRQAGKQLIGKPRFFSTCVQTFWSLGAHLKQEIPELQDSCRQTANRRLSLLLLVVLALVEAGCACSCCCCCCCSGGMWGLFLLFLLLSLFFLTWLPGSTVRRI